jgi:hypothetical protein
MNEKLLPDDRREPAGAVLLIALAIGTILRFFRLGAHELSIDESLSWAESSGHNIKAVLRVQHQLDSGKFPIYEIAQHGWMRIFGDSETAMRALPALIGSLSIVLVFILTVEVLLAASGGSTDSESAPREPGSPVKERLEARNRIYLVAALCALLFAVGLPSVEIARQARMYSMMEAWILAQVIFLYRARRLGGFTNFAGLTFFSAIAMATNFTAALVIVAEALWLIYLYLADSDARSPKNPQLWWIGAALIAAIVLLLPFFAGLRYGVEGVARGDYDWIKPPGRWEPFATFESGLGTLPFPLFALFAIAGAVRWWRAHRDQAVLLILWIVAPPLILFAGSYLVTPMLVTRYLISSFVPLFIFTVIGIESVPSRHYRSLAIVAIVSLSVLRVSSDFRRGDDRWREACQTALDKAGPHHRVGTYNEFFLVEYYMPESERSAVKVIRIPFEGVERKAPRVVILSPTVPPADVTEIRRQYPQVAGEYKNVLVVSRPGARVPAASPGC